jgi:hypothetical protein
VNLMNGANSRMNIAADADGTTLRYGADGINPNATSAEKVTGPDADVFPQGIGNIGLFGGTGPDTIGAQGGAGTGNPRTDPVEIEGGAGVDRLTGGEGGDRLGGEGGNDILSGGGGNDGLTGGPDNDLMNGGPGSDSAHSGGLASAVSVDLAIVGPQNTGPTGIDALANIENVTGTAGADTLRGNAAANRLQGVQGEDVLIGRGGIDELEGREEADTLDVRDGGADTADCGPDVDTVIADPPGTDTLIECENRLFPDLDAPETTITSGPKRRTRKRKARFELSSDDPEASLTCRIDGEPFAPCSSPFTHRVKRRRHIFEARATDAAGNPDPTPAQHVWKVKKKRKRR